MARITYPVALDIEGKRCLVVGGGTIAADKVDGLLAAGAEVVVVSPSVLPRVAQLVAWGNVEYHARTYRPTDLEDVYLAYGATDDTKVNARVAADARAAGVVVNAVDDPPNCDFYAVAIVRRGDLQVGISTNGRSPAFARWLREDLDARLPAEYADLLDVLADVRRELRARGTIPAYEHWQVAISEEVLHRLQHGDRAGARERIWEVLSRAQDGSGADAGVTTGVPTRWGERSA
jgi:precorrin-2 dehydrogenase/sirohydrochlorin ferrochelatase